MKLHVGLCKSLGISLFSAILSEQTWYAC